MMNVKETLKRLHKKFPMMGLDELFDVLDCYVENTISSTIDSQQPKIWHTNENKVDKITTTINTDPLIYTLNGTSNETVKYYDGRDSTQLVADH